MPNTEFRFAELQTPDGPSAGRMLMGICMRYGSIGQGPNGMPEVFTPGAFGDVSNLDISLNFMHQREKPLARTGGGGLTLSDSGSMLSMAATLPRTTEANDALELVRTKVMRGLSVEFFPRQDRMENGTRIIAKAQLVGIGVVDTGAAHHTTLEARRQQHEQRARLSLTISGIIPYEEKLDCRCQTGSCTAVRLKPKSLAQAAEPDSTALLVMGDYSKPIASVAKRSLQLTDTPQGLIVGATIPDSQAGRDLIALASSVPLLIRPIFDQKASTFIEEGGVATYTHMSLRGLTIGATDQAAGWPEAVISEPEAPPVTLEEPPQEPRGLHSEQKRVLSWL